MTVAVQICNSALIKLGQEPVTNLLEDNKRARECNIRYPMLLEDCLRDHPWNFAIKREVISKSTDTLPFGEGDLYDIPLDCVRVLKLSGFRDSRPRYKIEGSKIISYSDTEGGSINLVYVSKNIPENLFDSKFKEAVATKLAAELCYSLTQSTTLKQTLLSEYMQYLQDARSVSSQEVSPDDFRFDYFDNARRVGHEIYRDPDFY